VEDLMSDWPSPEHELPGIFFICHDVSLSSPEEIRWEAWLSHAIVTEGYELARIDYIFCSDEFLLEINRAHLGHDFYTDIITFPLNANPIMAEIYISVDRVKENATLHQTTFDQELHRVMIHGILHLCGYQDHDEDEKAVIRKKEDYYLSLYR
jgi:rRNA maturation RNase YbeY